MNDLDTWLDEELREGFLPFSSAAIPSGAPYRSRRSAPAQPWFAARIATRTAVVVVAAALGLVATGALAAAAVTGTVDPQVWTEHFTTAISSCTGQGASGQGAGIGGCLDAVIHFRGAKSLEPRAADGSGSARSLASPAPEVTSGGKPADAKKAGPDSSPGPNPNGLLGRPAGVPFGPPTDSPHGRPSDLPAGAASPHGNAPTAKPTPQGKAPTTVPTKRP